MVGEKGLAMYSSAPMWNPVTSSRSLSRAVSIKIGTSDLLRISRQASYPSLRGIITSSMTSTTSSLSSNFSTACWPSAASTTLKPSRTR